MENISVRDIMSCSASACPGISVTPDTSLDEAARVMHLHRIDVLCVVSAEGNLIGKVTASDVARAKIELLPQPEQDDWPFMRILSGMLVK